jgi:hypothetical protein
MITTTLGDREESTLVKSEGVIDNANEFTRWVEYRETADGEIIHRSVHVHLKEGLLAESGIGGF